jgi:hypothetical protein
MRKPFPTENLDNVQESDEILLKRLAKIIEILPNLEETTESLNSRKLASNP